MNPAPLTLLQSKTPRQTLWYDLPSSCSGGLAPKHSKDCSVRKHRSIRISHHCQLLLQQKHLFIRVDSVQRCEGRPDVNVLSPGKISAPKCRPCSSPACSCHHLFSPFCQGDALPSFIKSSPGSQTAVTHATQRDLPPGWSPDPRRCFWFTHLIECI